MLTGTEPVNLLMRLTGMLCLSLMTMTLTKPGITRGRNSSTLWTSVSPRLFSFLEEVIAHGYLKSSYRESAERMHSINLPKHLVTSPSTNTTETSLLTSLGWQKKAFFHKINPKHPKDFWKACKVLYKSSGSSIPVLSSDGKTAASRSSRNEAQAKAGISYTVGVRYGKDVQLCVAPNWV